MEGCCCAWVDGVSWSNFIQRQMQEHLMFQGVLHARILAQLHSNAEVRRKRKSLCMKTLENLDETVQVSDEDVNVSLASSCMASMQGIVQR